MTSDLGSYATDVNLTSQSKSVCDLWCFPSRSIDHIEYIMANNEYYSEASDVSAIFFDLDNTLIQTRKGDTKACNKVCIFYLF